VCSSGFHEQRKIDAALLRGDTIDAAMKKFAYLGFSKSGVTRHRLHMDKVVRAPQRIDEDRSAADVLVSLADTFFDLDRAQSTGGYQRLTPTATVRAATERRSIGKLIFSDLAFDSTASAQWLRDIDVVWQGMRRVMSRDPLLALALADAVQSKDPRMAKELRDVHDLLTTTRENAAA
jgi:hypothetical protein